MRRQATAKWFVHVVSYIRYRYAKNKFPRIKVVKKHNHTSINWHRLCLYVIDRVLILWNRKKQCMKSLYLMCAAALLMLVSKTYAQQTVIPDVAAANNAQRTNVITNTSRVDDSMFNHIRILPNLAAGRITLIIDDANANVIQQGECVVYNNGGTPVAKSPFTTGTTDIFVSNFPVGMYYIKLMQRNGQAAIRKFVVMK